MANPQRPTHDQLMLPLLDEINQLGGRATPGELYERLATRLNIPQEVLTETKTFENGTTHRLWERRVRWARQTAVMRGLLASPKHGIWELTAVGGAALAKIRHGRIFTIFETNTGIALWANAEDAASVIERCSIPLIFCSTPYPIHKARAYGGMSSPAWLEWMKRLGAMWKELITTDGSVMINLGQVCNQNTPTQDPYIERFILMMIDDLGYYLADRLAWHNPSKLPSPMPWVADRRVRCTPSVEPILWFSKSAHCKADNRKVLDPYSPRSAARNIGKPGKAQTRRSGYDFGANSFAKDNGGRIPSNLIIARHGGGPTTHYVKRCMETNLPPHPATSPAALPTRAILMTTDIGDPVYDPLAGSGVTAKAAASLDRRWITSERALAYVQGQAFHFEDDPTFRAYPIPDGRDPITYR